MRNPTDVLNSLRSKSQTPNYHYERLYRNLYNSEFHLLAYLNIYANAGNMTAGTDEKTIDGMGMERIERLISSLKDHSYQPNPARRTYIKKKNGKLRPLGIPSFDDKLVQEIVRTILEAIYEPTFSPRSHGFRPNKSCHTALLQIQANFSGVKWFVEGDIKGFFDTIPAILIAIDDRQIELAEFHKIPYVLQKDVQINTDLSELYYKSCNEMKTFYDNYYDGLKLYTDFLQKNGIPVNNGFLL